MLFAVNYRRSPEVDISVTLDDVLQTYIYLVKDLGIPSSSIHLMGESAG